MTWYLPCVILPTPLYPFGKYFSCNLVFYYPNDVTLSIIISSCFVVWARPTVRG
jgi:hypothetical protein